ncbi:MAG: PTS sugar transporter subunit IIC [Mycoplasmataceae bacterium]|nr:PTS sugar transporter subunit IIC [Mycoplasmataceae bacterium]
MNSKTQTNSTKEKMKHGWDVFIMRMGKLAEQRHMSSLRDGFALIVPLIIAASVGVICMTFVFGWWDTVSTSILGWITMGIPNQTVTNAGGTIVFVNGSIAHQISTVGTFIFYTIWKGIFNYLSIFVTLTISYSFARIKNIKDPFIASLIGLGGFMIFSYGSADMFGTGGMLVSILASLLSMELYSVFENNKKLELNLPAGVPPAVARSFSKLFPTIFTLLIFIAIQAPFIIFRHVFTWLPTGDAFGIGHTISIAVQAPFMSLIENQTGSLSLGLVYATFSALLWFFGIHGTNVLTAVFSPVALVALANNQLYLETGGVDGSISAFADGTNDAFVFFGGVGSTLALVLVGLLFSKKADTREIIKFGGAPALFNINEPLIFGVPLILNFKYVVPFIIIQPLLFFITWFAIEVLKWVPPVIVKIPWTTPVGIGGFLATSSWQGIILSLMNFSIACLIYAPFVLIANKSAKKNGEELVSIDYKGGWQKFTAKITNKKVVKKGGE